MKRYITSFLLVALLASGPLFGFGGGFNGFPGFGNSFPGFNPGGIGADEKQAEEKSVEFAVLAGYSGVGHSEISGIAFAPSIQLRLTTERFQFTVDGTYWEPTTQGDIKVIMVYGGLGYQLVKAKAFNLSASVVAGYSYIKGYGTTLYPYYSGGYYSGGYYYYQRVNTTAGFLIGGDLLAMLRLGEHFGIYANGLLSTGGIGAKLGIAWHF